MGGHPLCFRRGVSQGATQVPARRGVWQGGASLALGRNKEFRGNSQVKRLNSCYSAARGPGLERGLENRLLKMETEVCAICEAVGADEVVGHCENTIRDGSPVGGGVKG